MTRIKRPVGAIHSAAVIRPIAYKIRRFEKPLPAKHSAALVRRVIPIKITRGESHSVAMHSAAVIIRRIAFKATIFGIDFPVINHVNRPALLLRPAFQREVFYRERFTVADCKETVINIRVFAGEFVSYVFTASDRNILTNEDRPPKVCYIPGDGYSLACFSGPDAYL
jgi:hypothetical protein